MSALIQTGSRVFLKGCPYGQPGTAIRLERGQVVVYWSDIDFWSRHSPESLMLAPEKGDSDAA